MEKISKEVNIWKKLAMPGLFLALLIFVLFTAVLSGAENFSFGDLLYILVIVPIIVYSIYHLFVARPVVWFDGEKFKVSLGGKESFFDLDDVRDVVEERWFKIGKISLHLRRDIGAGKILTFDPNEKFATIFTGENVYRRLKYLVGVREGVRRWAKPEIFLSVRPSNFIKFSGIAANAFVLLYIVFMVYRKMDNSFYFILLTGILLIGSIIAALLATFYKTLSDISFDGEVLRVYNGKSVTKLDLADVKELTQHRLPIFHCRLQLKDQKDHGEYVSFVPQSNNENATLVIEARETYDSFVEKLRRSKTLAEH